MQSFVNFKVTNKTIPITFNRFNYLSITIEGLSPPTPFPTTTKNNVDIKRNPNPKQK
jgi:hypothetical protein